jgi:SWI/SNF-related matrix-associated actin-dependent regulator 1 of chromatin subfamily A
MPLTPDQIKLMEENRRKALEKRAAAKKAESNQVIMINNRSNFSVGHSAVLRPSSPAINPSAGKTPAGASSFYSRPQYSGGKSNWNSPSSSNKYQPKNSNFNSSASSSRPIATFQLISRRKFCVDAPFDNEMIEIFKKIPTKSYDGVLRRWTFPLSEHQKLLESLDPLLTRFQFQPLPKFVLDIFRYNGWIYRVLK